MKDRFWAIIAIIICVFWAIHLAWYMQPERRFLRYVDRMWKRDGYTKEQREYLLPQIPVDEWLEHQK